MTFFKRVREILKLALSLTILVVTSNFVYITTTEHLSKER